MTFKPIYSWLFLLGAVQILWLPAVTHELLLIMAACWLLLVVYWRARTRGMHVLWLTSGLLYAALACQLQIQQQLAEPVERDVVVEIQDLPRVNPQKTSFVAKDLASGQRYLLSDYAASINYQVDQTYHMTVRLKPPHGTVNGVGFDREKWLFRHGIDAIGHIKAVAQPSDEPVWSLSPNRWRAWFSTQIDQNFPDEQINALIHALSIGDKSRFSHDDKQLFQVTGTAHLIAISGLHIGMVALFGWFLGAGLFRLIPNPRWPRPVIQVLVGLLLASVYAALAGFTVATQRALIMLLVYGVLKLSRRPAFAWDVWSLSLLLVLLLDPLNVLDGGFWLSFTAVAVLILAFNGMRQQSSKWSAFWTMQWTLLLGMLPLSLALFARINLLAPLINLLMIPLMTVLVMPVMMVLLLSAIVFGGFAQPLIGILTFTCEWLITILSWLRQFDQLTFQVGIAHAWQYLCLALGALLLSLPALMPQRFWGMVLLLLGLHATVERPIKGHFNLHVLDVGQGLSVLIETQQHTVVYDVGPAFDSGFNMADAVLLPYLQQRQINHIDVLILSHRDNDHAGAAPAFQAGMAVDQVWDTETQQSICQAGHQWVMDAVTFTFVSPLNVTPYLRNNSSCVLKVENSEFSVLLTGDIEAPVEYRLTQQDDLDLSSDVMLMPHHGSKSSSTPAFVDAVNPDWVINSSGRYNPFNHPAESVLARYADRNIEVIDTQTSGRIMLSSNRPTEVQSLRAYQPKIWRTKKPE